jgi:Ni/Fe-hydrogenase subunit HybB-like protein
VGIAAAAVLPLIPAYLYRDESVGEVLVFGELMAIAAVAMCFLFLMVDLGRPERLWHLLPLVGVFNWPASLLCWDVIAVGGYFLLNLYLVTRLLYRRFRGRDAATGAGADAKHKPSFLIYLTIVWAISIHTVTAFLYSGLGGRPYWNAAIVAPHFIASAFASGTAMMIVTLGLLEARMKLPTPSAARGRLRQIAAVSMWINLFLFASELFSALYAGTGHAQALRYRLFGLNGHFTLVPYTWLGIALELFGTMVLVVPALYRRLPVLVSGCAAAVVGVWIEKGMGLVVPGFVPTPLGETIDYSPSLAEFLISAGIWAGGALLFTLMVKAAAPVQLGQLRSAASRSAAAG